MSRMTSKFLAWTTGLLEVPLDKMKKAKGRTDNRIWGPNAEFTFGHDELEISMEFKCVWLASEYQSFVSCNHYEFLTSLVAQAVKHLSAMQEPGLGRSPGEGNGTPLQYSCLENPMESGGLQSRGSQRVRSDLLAEQQQIGMLVFLFIFLLPQISSLW